MINEELTFEKFGYYSSDLTYGSAKHVISTCPACLENRELSKSKFTKSKTGLCKKCASSKVCIVRNGPVEPIEEIPPWILVEETIEEFGYDPRLIGNKSNLKVITKCLICNKCRKATKHCCMKASKCVKCNNREACLIRNKAKSPIIDLPSWILVEKTVEKFGYDPQLLGNFVNKKVVVECISCKTQRIIAKSNAMHSPLCYSCSMETEEYKEKRLKASQEAKGRIPWNKGIQMSKEFCEKNRQAQLKCLKIGKDSPSYGRIPPHGKGEWYTRKDGSKVWMRSSWEIAFATYLDSRNILWEYELGPFHITYNYENKTKEGTYRPDFYLCSTNEYIEVKGYWREDAKTKYEAFKTQYPKIKIEVFDEKIIKEIKKWIQDCG